MNTAPVIECKPSKWFKIRAVLVIIMLTFFALWFLKDGMWGYRQKNLEYVTYQLFQAPAKGQPDYVVNAITLFKAGDKDGKPFSEESWEEFASQQVLSVPAESRGLLPREYDYSAKWPEELVQGFDRISKGKQLKIWNDVSGRNGWNQEAPHDLLDEGKIHEQFVVSGVCAGLIAIALFYIIRIFTRNMRVTEEAYYAPGGAEVPFTSMRKIDKRKWDTKGIALITYETENGAMKKAKVDGMLYGQFQEEDGAPAEALMAFIMEHFKGEVVEYVTEGEEEDGSDDSHKVDAELVNKESVSKGDSKTENS